MNLDEIRDYIGKIARAAGVGSNAEWADRAGVDADVLERFLDGADIGLADFVALSRAVDAFVVPMPNARQDEAIMLLEDEGILADGVVDPFAKYRDM